MKEKLYSVMFDTQRDRRYITWGIFLLAANQKEAKKMAHDLWHGEENPHYRFCHSRPHMFHTNAMRWDDNDLLKTNGLRKFYKVYEKHATWG